MVDYSRGKGLGGTSLINFMLWNRGAGEDWDAWSERVGSKLFAWENVKKVFGEIERLSSLEYEDEDEYSAREDKMSRAHSISAQCKAQT